MDGRVAFIRGSANGLKGGRCNVGVRRGQGEEAKRKKRMKDLQRIEN